MFLAADELTKKQTGRKALIVLTDGVDRGSRTSLESAIESAQRSDTLVYAIYFAGEEGQGMDRRDRDRAGGYGRPRIGLGGGGGPIGGSTGPMGGPGRDPGGGQGRGTGGGQRGPREERPDGKKILQRICRETGGRMYEVSKKQPVDKIYTQLEEELRNQYNLGYTPDQTENGNFYRRIQLTTTQKDLMVQARDGYYMKP